MKKYFFLIFALCTFAFTSCDKEDDPIEPSPVANEPNYYFKVEEANIELLSGIFNADTCYFYAENDYAMRELCDKIPEGIRYEICRTDGTFVCASDDIVKASGGTSSGRGYTVYPSYLGTKYHVCTYYPDSGEPYYPWNKSICSYGEPLTNVLTANNYWSAGDTKDIMACTYRCYYYTGDLNSDCGASSRYTRIFFSGRKHTNVMFWTSDGDAVKERIPEQKYDASPITGLRLVCGESKEAKDITDSDGIVWHPALMYYNDDDKYNTYDNYRCGADLNNGGGGDWLYLYYTRDTRTGRKLMIVHPYLAAYSHLNTIGGDDAIHGALMGSGLATWVSGTWDVDIDDLLKAVADGCPTNYSKNPYTDNRRVDFIRLYDKNMNPFSGDIRTKDGKTYTVPANFNRKAKGDDEIFISYSFITPDDESWSKF